MEYVWAGVALSAVAMVLFFRSEAAAWRDLYRDTDESRDRWVDRYMALTADMRRLTGSHGLPLVPAKAKRPVRGARGRR